MTEARERLTAFVASSMQVAAAELNPLWSHQLTLLMEAVAGEAVAGLRLMGVSEVAEYLGVTRARVGQLAANHPDFPTAVARVRATPLYTRSSIETFLAGWDRSPGRHNTLYGSHPPPARLT